MRSLKRRKYPFPPAVTSPLSVCTAVRNREDVAFPIIFPADLRPGLCTTSVSAFISFSTSARPTSRGIRQAVTSRNFSNAPTRKVSTYVSPGYRLSLLVKPGISIFNFLLDLRDCQLTADWWKRCSAESSATSMVCSTPCTPSPVDRLERALPLQSSHGPPPNNASLPPRGLGQGNARRTGIQHRPEIELPTDEQQARKEVCVGRARRPARKCVGIHSRLR